MSVTRRPVPMDPLDFAAVLERWPTIRQSLASGYDDCALSAWFSLRYGQGWSTTPQARGTIFHRTAAEILRTLQRNGAVTIPRREAVQILIEVAHQHGVAPADIVRVPLRAMPELVMAVDKFAKDNEFSIHKIVDIEKRLEAELPYPAENGSVTRRIVTGTLDALLYDPPDGAVVLDWKDSWALPPEPKETESQGYDDEELKGLSYHGYFQQRWYGYLVLMNYSNVNRVTLREFYHRKTKVRKATLHRHQLPEVEQELGIVVAALDRALGQGRPDLKPAADGLVDIDALGWWKPQPGKHCSFCNRPTSCPIEEEVRVAAGGGVTEQNAQAWAARLLVANQIRKIATEGLKGLADMGGPPTPVRWSKGRQVIGWYETKRGRRFGAYTPQESDRGAHPDADAQLAEAMRESTARARAERGVKPRRRGGRRRTPA